MRKIFTLLVACLVAFSSGVDAQTTHNVTISGFSFSPPSLTIEVGDEVVWTNSTGTGHNVNGTTATFPGNPESFGNSVGTSWTYSHTFTTAGSYTYQCDPHAGGGMSGQITVNNTSTGIAELSKPKLNVFPNPATDEVSFDLAGLDIEEEMVISLYNTLGEKVKEVEVNSQNMTIDVAELASGVYIYQLESGSLVVEKDKFLVQ